MNELVNLRVILAQAKLQKDNPALYQVIDTLINRIEELSKSITALEKRIP